VTGRDALLDTAMALHDAAMRDEYFTKRKLAPNVDFWSGLIYRAMGFPLDFFPSFVCRAESGRMAGSLASDDDSRRRREDLEAKTGLRWSLETGLRAN